MGTVTALISEVDKAMASHPAGKGKDAEVVYSTTTGEEPRGNLTLTEEATAPLPPPEKRVRKTTVQEAQVRVSRRSSPTCTSTWSWTPR